MNAVVKLPSSSDVRERMQTCREELAALKRQLRAAEAAERADQARRARQAPRPPKGGGEWLPLTAH